MKYIAAGLLCLSGVYARAATYYVSPTGSDSNPGTISQPWQHVCYAAGGRGTIGNDGAGGGGTACSTANPNALKAGDTLFLRAGTYSEYYIEFVNSGANGSPIILTPYNGESVTIDGGWAYQGCGTGCPHNPIFYLDGKNYLTFDGGPSRSFTVTRGETMNFWISENNPTSGITIQNMSITNFTYGDNSAHIYLNDSADNITIKNNSLHDCIGCLQPISGSSSIIMFNVYSVDIENNEIYSQPANPIHAGINFKHSFYQNHVRTVRNNLMHDLTSSDYSASCIITNADDTAFSNNVCYNSDWAVQLYIVEATCDRIQPFNNIFNHNTFDGMHYGVVFDQSNECPANDHDNTFRNSIINTTSASSLAGFVLAPYYSGTPPPNITQEYNLIYTPDNVGPVKVEGNSYTASCPGCYTGFLGNYSASIQQAPIFINYAAHNYTLASYSPGHNAASDGTDMGAQFCAVGVNASCSTASAAAPPAAPRGFTLR